MQIGCDVNRPFFYMYVTPYCDGHNGFVMLTLHGWLVMRAAKKNCLGLASPQARARVNESKYCDTFRVVKTYHTCSYEMNDSHGAVPWVSHEATSTSAPYIDTHLLLLTTITFHAVSFFGGYVRHVMSVTLPKPFKLMRNENRISNNH